MNEPLAYEHLVVKNQAAFIEKVRKISANLGIDPNWLMIVMAGETAFTMSPSIRSGNQPDAAVGLIQFIGITATALGTTKDDLAKMTNIEQLDYVEKYFILKKGKGNMKTLGDVYVVVFAPAWLGLDDSTVAYKAGSKAYNDNVSLDVKKKGNITIGDIKTRVNKWIPKKKSSIVKGIEALPNYYAEYYGIYITFIVFVILAILIWVGSKRKQENELQERIDNISDSRPTDPRLVGV